MRYILLALFVVGCGEASLPVDSTTNWSVTLGSWEAPMCGNGTMTLRPSAQKAPFEGATYLEGTWGCGVYGTAAHADIRDDGRVFLNLETEQGFMNGVRGTLEAGDAIAGDILLDDALVRFAAYRQ